MTVPRKAYTPLRVLAGMAEADVPRLIEALGQPEKRGVTSPKQLAEKVEEAVEGFDGQTARDLVSTLFNLTALHFTHDWSIDQVVEVVASNSDIGFPDDVPKDEIRSRISALLSVPTVFALAKATSVAYESANLFHTSRVISDIRPVFGDDPNADPVGAMVVHTLRIDYFKERGLDSVFLSLTEGELAQLSATLSRATDKHASLRRVIESTGLEEFNAEFE